MPRAGPSRCLTTTRRLSLYYQRYMTRRIVQYKMSLKGGVFPTQDEPEIDEGRTRHTAGECKLPCSLPNISRRPRSSSFSTPAPLSALPAPAARRFTGHRRNAALRGPFCQYPGLSKQRSRESSRSASNSAIWPKSSSGLMLWSCRPNEPPTLDRPRVGASAASSSRAQFPGGGPLRFPRKPGWSNAPCAPASTRVCRKKTRESCAAIWPKSADSACRKSPA